MGGQLTQLLEGADPADLGPPPGPEAITIDPVLDRVHTFLLTSLGQMFVGMEAKETLALAALACDVADDDPRAEVCRWITTLIRERASYRPRGPERPARFAPGLPFVVLAATLARTPDVPLPELAPTG
jgi:hypothetical protein